MVSGVDARRVIPGAARHPTDALSSVAHLRLRSRAAATRPATRDPHRRDPASCAALWCAALRLAAVGAVLLRLLAGLRGVLQPCCLASTVLYLPRTSLAARTETEPSELGQPSSTE